MFARRATIAAMVAFLVLPLALAGCSATSGKASGSGKGGKAVPPRQLTKGTLPVEPGTEWTTADYAGEPVKLDLKVEGPWVLPSGAGWPTSTHTVVEPKDIPMIDAYSDVTYVVKEQADGADTYHVRRVDDAWVLQLGKIIVREGKASLEPNAEPVRFWPLAFRVGDEYLVSEKGKFTIRAKVLACNKATVPAGEIDNTYLVRFDYEPNDQSAMPATYYYMLAPDVGFVALLGYLEGSEEAGFTSASTIDVLATLPTKK